MNYSLGRTAGNVKTRLQSRRSKCRESRRSRLPPEQPQIQIPSGFICITTYGQLQQQTAFCLLEARSFCEKNGLTNCVWRAIPGTLVEKARNEAVRQALAGGFGWCLMIDGDTIFSPDAIIKLLTSAYGEVPQADVMGGYVPLRGDLALPTIDDGTGTWNSWYPGSGIVQVMRTGGAFLLVKRHVFEALKDPWFRMRVPARPIEFMAELDNFLNIKFDGRNPFRNLPNREWEQAEDAARNDPSVVAEQFVPVEVGEDSGFCDRVRNANMKIFVNTDVVCGHIDQKVVTWQDHKSAMERNETLDRQGCGILS